MMRFKTAFKIKDYVIKKPNARFNDKWKA